MNRALRGLLAAPLKPAQLEASANQVKVVDVMLAAGLRVGGRLVTTASSRVGAITATVQTGLRPTVTLTGVWVELAVEVEGGAARTAEGEGAGGSRWAAVQHDPAVEAVADALLGQALLEVDAAVVSVPAFGGLQLQVTHGTFCREPGRWAVDLQRVQVTGGSSSSNWSGWVDGFRCAWCPELRVTVGTVQVRADPAAWAAVAHVLAAPPVSAEVNNQPPRPEEQEDDDDDAMFRSTRALGGDGPDAVVVMMPPPPAQPSSSSSAFTCTVREAAVEVVGCCAVRLVQALYTAGRFSAASFGLDVCGGTSLACAPWRPDGTLDNCVLVVGCVSAGIEAPWPAAGGPEPGPGPGPPLSVTPVFTVPFVRVKGTWHGVVDDLAVFPSGAVSVRAAYVRETAGPQWVRASKVWRRADGALDFDRLEGCWCRREEPSSGSGSGSAVPRVSVAGLLDVTVHGLVGVRSEGGATWTPETGLVLVGPVSLHDGIARADRVEWDPRTASVRVAKLVASVPVTRSLPPILRGLAGAGGGDGAGSGSDLTVVLAQCRVQVTETWCVSARRVKWAAGDGSSWSLSAKEVKVQGPCAGVGASVDWWTAEGDGGGHCSVQVGTCVLAGQPELWTTVAQQVRAAFGGPAPTPPLLSPPATAPPRFTAPLVLVEDRFGGGEEQQQQQGGRREGGRLPFSPPALVSAAHFSVDETPDGPPWHRPSDFNAGHAVVWPAGGSRLLVSVHALQVQVDGLRVNGEAVKAQVRWWEEEGEGEAVPADGPQLRAKVSAVLQAGGLRVKWCGVEAGTPAGEDTPVRVRWDALSRPGGEQQWEHRVGLWLKPVHLSTDSLWAVVQAVLGVGAGPANAAGARSEPWIHTLRVGQPVCLRTALLPEVVLDAVDVWGRPLGEALRAVSSLWARRVRLPPLLRQSRPMRALRSWGKYLSRRLLP